MLKRLNTENRTFESSLCGLVLSLLLLATPATGSASSLTVGSLSNTPSEEIPTFLPFAEYLAAGLGDLGIDDARVKVSRNHAEMAELMKRGEVDLFIDSSVSALIMQRLIGGEFLARRWKKGIGEYHSVIFVRTESPVQNIADLAGHTIAFEEPFSSSGYLLPASEIRQAGLSLSSGQDQTGSDVVGYRFTGADQSTLLWVLNGRVEAGAMAENKLAKLSASLSGDLRVIHKSVAIPYHVVVNRAGLSTALLQAIHGRLLDMENSEAGRLTLKAFEKTTRVDDIPAARLLGLQALELD